MAWQWTEEEAVRELVESILRKIDPETRILLREPGRPSIPRTLRLALIRDGRAVPFDVSEAEWRRARSSGGRERLARRLGAALGLQPPDR
jgi:hypothetical protein